MSGCSGFRIRIMLLMAGALAGCAAQPTWTSRTPTADSPTVIEAPRSTRGNPPFYDVFGRRYFVLNSSSGYRERGVASWYGRDFHGLATASGETYDMYEMTAAHKTLPIPTWVEVTNLRNGKRAIVKVNDRGPFVDDRLIDLSFRAAETLDIVRDGTALVEVRALGVPVGEPSPNRVAAAAADGSSGNSIALISSAAAATVEASELSTGSMYVQVGAFSEHSNAVAMLDRLRAHGIAGGAVVSDSARQPPLHRVRVGPVRDAGEFDQVSGQLRSIGIDSTRLVIGQ
jgi:rare lipoprotein A